MIFTCSLKFPEEKWNFVWKWNKCNPLNQGANWAYIRRSMNTSETVLIQSQESVSPLNHRANHLAAQLKAGNTDSFEQLYEMFNKKIFNLCYRMFNSHDEASDLTQEIFVKVYRSIANFRGESNFYTWLYTIALNTCRNRREKVVRINRFETKLGSSEDGQDLIDSIFADPRASQNPWYRLEAEELRQWVADGISRLPQKYREIIVMKDINLMNYQQIAEILDCSLGTVKSRLNRARNLLKEKLESSKNLSEAKQKRGEQ